MHESTFEYLQPTPEQIETMRTLRSFAASYAYQLEKLLPDGADKTYILRQLRGLAMWVNVCVTREADGTPRT